MRVQIISIILNIFIIFLPYNCYCYRADLDKRGRTEHLTQNYFNLYNVKIFEELEMRYCDIKEIDEDAFINMTELKNLYLSDNYIQHLPTYTFSNLSSLQRQKLKCNEIQNLDSNLFKNLTKLTFIDLSQNNIDKIDKNLFTDLKYLETLYLSKNKISVIEMGAFDNNIQLRSLNLYQNQITELKNGIFINLLNLKKLYLSDNKIENIESHIFPLNSSLTEVNLSINNLQYLDYKIIQNLKKLKYLTIFDNPWNCDITLKKIVYISKNINLRVHPFYKFPTCVKPDALANKAWDSLTDEDFPSSISIAISTEPNDTLSVGGRAKLSCRNNLGAEFYKRSTIEWVYEDNTTVVNSLEAAGRLFMYTHMSDNLGMVWDNITIHNVQKSDEGVYKCVLKMDDTVVEEKSQNLLVHWSTKPEIYKYVSASEINNNVIETL